MQIVIKISEGFIDKMNSIKDDRELSWAQLLTVYRGFHAMLQNGVVLPKGHGDLKDMSNLQYVFDLSREDPIYSGKDIERAIKSMKSIIEADNA